MISRDARHRAHSTLVLAVVALMRAVTIAAASEPAHAISSHGPLDGMVFVGTIGPAGREGLDDELHFNDGHMWSMRCLACGYQPAPYWVREADSRLLFRATLSKEGGSVFEYEGALAAPEMSAEVEWTKRRWYWRIERDLLLDASLAPHRRPVGLAEAAETASAAAGKPADLPSWCP